ncbi:Deleted in malignant brain tumors 1 protein [Saguinus oedipus]|uniref:Deleted in malignant brain tumors 1 protein n=1 Tax=Saguinus oedipus TaxID=9490 RepID=A0ABQ9UPV1_SAGOE|nr:Deleted in malignant brain tumors 1 protein [Saguinus oedipus]
MLQNTWVDTMYIANDTIRVEEVQYGNFDVNISFYSSSSFLYPVTSSPYYVDLNQNLYLQAEILHSDATLALFVDTCVASPYYNDFTSLTYDLIRSGCVKDESYRPYSQPSPGIARFRFSAFHFLSRFPSVYLQCKMVVCRAYDYSSRCYRGCVVRSKRDVGSYQEKVDVILGPIQLQTHHTKKRSLDLLVADVEEMASTTTPAGVFLAVVLAAAAFTLGRKTCSTSGRPLSSHFSRDLPLLVFDICRTAGWGGSGKEANSLDPLGRESCLHEVSREKGTDRSPEEFRRNKGMSCIPRKQ